MLTTPEFNIQDAIAKLGGDSKFKPADIDNDPANVQEKLEVLRVAVKNAAVRSKRGSAVSPEQREKVKLFFHVLASLDVVTPALRYETISLFLTIFSIARIVLTTNLVKPSTSKPFSTSSSSRSSTFLKNTKIFRKH